jgi:hypothetical protein
LKEKQAVSGGFRMTTINHTMEILFQTWIGGALLVGVAFYSVLLAISLFKENDR